MFNVNPSHEDLDAAIRRNGIELPAEQIALLAEYCRLLWDWNSKLNLTRHTDCEKFVTRDLVDSLAFAKFLRPGESVLDVGTGGGVPGVVLAIVRSDLKLSLCESVAKKARAVADIVEHLRLRAAVYHARAEDLLGDLRFDTLVFRAVARLRKLLEWFKPRWQRFDRMLVLTGPSWVEQRGEARHYGLLKGMALRKLKTYPMPDSHAESVLLQICPDERLASIEEAAGAKTPAKAPRRKDRRA